MGSMCQQVFSAALLGFLESRNDLTEDAKNKLSSPIPHPDTKEDVVVATYRTLANKTAWKGDSGLSGWLRRSRLYSDSPLHGPPGLVALKFMIRNVTKLPILMTIEKKSEDNLRRIVS